MVKGKSSTSVHVREVMTPAERLMTVTPNHSVLEVMEMMNDNNFRHVPVVCVLACILVYSCTDFTQCRHDCLHMRSLRLKQSTCRQPYLH